MRAMPWARLRSDSSAFGCNCDVPVAGQAIQYAASKGAAATQKQTTLRVACEAAGANPAVLTESAKTCECTLPMVGMPASPDEKE